MPKIHRVHAKKKKCQEESNWQSALFWCNYFGFGVGVHWFRV